MTSLHVDPRDAVPIWKQIEHGMRRLVASGALAPGVPAPSVRDLSRELRVNPNTVSKAYQSLAPGASKTIKRWPVDNFAEIGKRLHENTGWTGVICGGGADRPLGSSLASKLPGNPIDLTGRTTLAELVSVVARARFLLANESAPLHIAAAMGTPAVLVAGGGHFGQFVPYPEDQLEDADAPETVTRRMPCFGCNWNCVYPLEKISPLPVSETSAVTRSGNWSAVDSLPSARPLRMRSDRAGRLPLPG